MFGPRLSTVFASRWRALWFCASVMLGAYLMVPGDEPSPVQSADEAGQSMDNARNAIEHGNLSAEQRAEAEATLDAIAGLSGDTEKTD